VAIVATATATNFVTANPEQVFIRLVPVGVILPPAGAPTAAFTYSPTAASAGLPIQFDASTSLPGTGATQISTYSWNFGDGTAGSGSNVTHKFGAGNNFVVTLTVINDRGLAASQSQTLSVIPAALPTPSFTVSPLTPAVNQVVFFNGQASTAGQGHTIESYRWNFGDGTSGSGSTVTHAFTATGTYSVQLTVTDDLGASVTSGGTQVAVGAVPTPTANFTFSPASPVPGASVLFDGSSSTPGVGHTLRSYAWTFGDFAPAPGATLVRPSHAYSAAGTFTVTLMVTDDVGQTSVNSKAITVSNAPVTPPSASFTFSPSAPVPNQAVLFNAASSTAGAGHTLASYAWTFGDAATATGVAPSHPYSAAGTFTVTLTVTDEIGQTSVTSKTVTIAPAVGTPPTARFTFSPAAPVPNQAVLFNASSSTPGVGHTIPSTGYAWNFGDGATGTGVTPSRSYSAAGTYTVTLTVTDETGQTSVISQAVTVATAVGTPPTARFTFSPSAPAPNQAVLFNASSSTPGAGHTIPSYAWTFGDGTTGTGVTATRAYSTAGTYSVQLKVTDEIGQSTTSAASQIPVGSPPAPTANFTSSPLAPVVNQAVVFDASSSTTAQGQTITSLAWNFGDDTPVVICPSTGSSTSTDCAANTSGRIASHKFTTAGTFTVNLVVTDSAGRVGAKSAQVIVGSGNPVAVITFSPAAPKVAGTVNFDSAGTTTSGSATITTYAWTFPSGSPASSASASPSVSWATSGTFTVRLTVTDSQGRVGTTTASVVVVP